MKIFQLNIIIVSVILIVGCTSHETKLNMTAQQCEEAKKCKVSGSLAIKSDGHGFIGELSLEDGSCIDVSVPNNFSERYRDQPAQMLQLEGPVFPYPNGEDIIELKINGRKIGVGLCGNFYVFVKNETDIKLQRVYRR